MSKNRTIANLGTGFVNISDTGTEGTKVASGTTAQRGSTTGQFRFNSTTGKFEGRTASNFVSLEATPIISSVDDTEVDSAGGGNQTFVITGSNFNTGDVVSFVGNDGTTITASTTTINSSTQITAVIAKSSFANSKEPYDIKVTTTGGIFGILENQINVDNVPTFSTASGNLGNISSLATGNHFTISATDPEGTAVTFAETGATNIAGAGLSLSSAGVISGDPTDVGSDTTVSFTVRATSNGKTSDRAFNIIINPIPNGSSRTLALPVGATENPITRFLSLRSESDGSATEGVYWFRTTNTAGTTYVFPTVIRNFNSTTWLMLTKNYRQHAYKTANSDSNTSGGNSSANNSAHELSYGLIASDGSALVTNANILGSASNIVGTSSTLGTYHCAVAIKSFGDNVFTQTAFHGRDNNTRYLTRSDLTDKIHRGQNPATGQYEDNTWYTPSSGSGYMYFNTRNVYNDNDTMRLGLTPYNSVQHDRHNSPAEHTGTTWFQDGNDGYTTANSDNMLNGTSGYSSDPADSGYGRISIWVK